MRSLVLLLAVVLSGITATILSAYFLLPEWTVFFVSRTRRTRRKASSRRLGTK